LSDDSKPKTIVFISQLKF